MRRASIDLTGPGMQAIVAAVLGLDLIAAGVTLLNGATVRVLAVEAD